MTTLTHERFEKDIAEHAMTILVDNGVYRHVRFKRPDSSMMHFDLITWPGHLCYAGDMGTYVFSRLNDMFEFFRRPEHCRYSIDMRYWAEKCKAGDKSGRGDGIREWSKEKFADVINEYRVRWIREAHDYGSMDKAERRELWEAVQNNVLDLAEDGEHAACEAAHGFIWQADRDRPGYSFQDFWEYSFDEYTNRFQWCCMALSWAIQVYDKACSTAVGAE